MAEGGCDWSGDPEGTGKATCPPPPKPVGPGRPVGYEELVGWAGEQILSSESDGTDAFVLAKAIVDAALALPSPAV